MLGSLGYERGATEVVRACSCFAGAAGRAGRAGRAGCEDASSGRSWNHGPIDGFVERAFDSFKLSPSRSGHEGCILRCAGGPFLGDTWWIMFL